MAKLIFFSITPVFSVTRPSEKNSLMNC